MKKCFLFHKWGRVLIFSNQSSNIIDYSKKCKKCGKLKQWSTPRLKGGWE